MINALFAIRILEALQDQGGTVNLWPQGNSSMHAVLRTATLCGLRRTSLGRMQSRRVIEVYSNEQWYALRRR